MTILEIALKTKKSYQRVWSVIKMLADIGTIPKLESGYVWNFSQSEVNRIIAFLSIDKRLKYRKSRITPKEIQYITTEHDIQKKSLASIARKLNYSEAAIRKIYNKHKLI